MKQKTVLVNKNSEYPDELIDSGSLITGSFIHDPLLHGTLKV